LIRRTLLIAATVLACGVFLLPARPAAADVRVLPDSTVLDVWQLENGLRVVVRHLPLTSHVALTLAWPVGSESDPKGQAGRASLLGELLMTAEAGDTPERTREELETLRPAGWGGGVSPRVTQLTEIVTRAQFPGTIRQFAHRLRGVTLSDSAVARGVARLRADLRAQRSPTSNTELYVAAREQACGGYDPAAAETGLRALSKLGAAELQALMRRTFVPQGAVLSLAGNLGDMNLRALIENEFGPIPAGTRAPEPPLRPLRAGALDLKRAGLKAPAGVLAIVAPSLEDSLHPAFYLNALFLGGYAQRQWPHSSAPLGSRFQYSLFDDPELARFYPPAGPGSAADSSLDFDFNDVVSRMGGMVFPPESFDALLRGVVWLLGAPLPPETLARATREPRVLSTLSSNQAVRELWGGEPFWAEYRRRLNPALVKQFYTWVNYLLDPNHRVKVLLHPTR